MREIKLRVWDKTRKMMFEAVAYYPTLKSVDVIYKYKDGVSNKVNLYGDTFELMQYTGLKDKNGREIYEGDIIKHCMGGSLQDYPSEVIWNDDGGWSPWLEYCRDSYTRVSEPEVIGNIYENPELLNK